MKVHSQLGSSRADIAGSGLIFKIWGLISAIFDYFGPFVILKASKPPKTSHNNNTTSVLIIQ